MFELLKNFKATIIVAFVCLLGAFFWGMYTTPAEGIAAGINCLTIAVILAGCELVLSFDNAVVNAKILKYWSPFWQKMFLTVGIIVAVFGVRLLLPAFAVSLSSGLGMIEVFSLALSEPAKYSEILGEYHYLMAAFGGTFLLMLFLSFLADDEKEHNWLGFIEKPAAKFLNSYTIYIFAAAILAGITAFVDPLQQFDFFKAGLYGIFTYLGLHLVGEIVERFAGIPDEDEAQATAKVVTGVAKGGIVGFLYLEFIDLSFSGDSLFAGLAVTNDIVLLMMGLAIGAMAVRCMTVYMVKKGVLDTYRYLEHGAMYAIAILAILLLSSTFMHLPEVVTGGASIAVIVLAIISSIKALKQDARTDSKDSV